MIWLLFGPRLLRFPLMLGVLVLVLISLRGAPLSLPTFATAQFRRFFDCGRAVRCMVPLGFGRFMHLVVLVWFSGC